MGDEPAGRLLHEQQEGLEDYNEASCNQGNVVVVKVCIVYAHGAQAVAYKDTNSYKQLVTGTKETSKLLGGYFSDVDLHRE